MKKRTASYTAKGAALYRYIYSHNSNYKMFCYDPYAKYFISRRSRISKNIPFVKYYKCKRYEQVVPGIVGQVIARTMYVDDYLKKCINDGIKQLVILGAGYDSRAYRFEELKTKTKVFEVDLPDTQERKIRKIKKIFGALPDHVTYVSIDFSTEMLGQRLIQCGYSNNLKTLFILEAVTQYITGEDVDGILSFVATNEGEDSSIIFDYLYSIVLDKKCKINGMKKMLNFFEMIGEPWIFGIEEGEVENLLTEKGFYKINNVNSKFLEKKYFKPVNEIMEISPFFGYVHATVKPK